MSSVPAARKKLSELPMADEVLDGAYTVLVQDGQTLRFNPKSLFLKATQELVSEGTDDNRFMTPYLTKLAVEQLTHGKDRYDLKIASTTGVLDLSAQQIFTVNATSNRTISFLNTPPAGRSMTVVIELQGSGGSITWPTITWNGGTAPTLGATSTVVVLLWTGTKWIGSVGASV